MFTATVLTFIAVMFWRAHARYRIEPIFSLRLAKAQWSWAFLGAAIGSFFGVAGMGDAIIGTVPGAVVGYLFAGYRVLKLQATGALPAPPSSLSEVECDSPAQTALIQPPGHARAPSSAASNPEVNEVRTVVQSAANSATSPSTTSVVFGWIVLLWIAGWGFSKFGASEPSSPSGPAVAMQAPASAPMAAPPSPKRPATAATTRQLTYAEALGKIETQYPVLNPDSPQFNAQTTDVVASRMNELKAGGTRPTDALRQAVREVLVDGARPAERPSVRQSPQQSTNNAVPAGIRRDLSNCVYKGVMSDDDYRDCGVQPPGTH